MHMNVGKWERVGSLALGTALLYFTRDRERRRVPGARSTAAGLLWRGVTGFCPVNAAIGRDSLHKDRQDTKEALGGSAGVHVMESVTVDAPVDEVYRFWRNLQNLPRFMRHLARVDELSHKQSHWVAATPAGMNVEWNAEIINDVPNRLIAWKTLPTSEVVSAGSVNFAPAFNGGTEIHVHLQYDPPAGHVGDWIAKVFGSAPSQMIREDLDQLRDLFSSGRSSLSPHSFQEPV
jgi:uncharacterized membrane protein